MLGKLMGKLFGGGSGGKAAVAADPVEYNGYEILADPIASGGQFNVAGTIRKSFPDGPKEHRFIRADTHGSRDDAIGHSVQKARQLIDEQGDRLFR
ncbi:HlyU family transcriptional regulator [Geminicoccus roseus]|uniref:HlyU family transcriptional regulator n=1 Tax=Geminicoccus roseus TaxID=404900 RepID=UPI0003FB856A|nr:HlyU family transcriptional regulator [Geminicoccus roseus]